MQRLFEAGIGHVVVCRHHPTRGETEVGVFLVDTFCLGVKDAFLTILPSSEVEELLEKVFGDEAKEALAPACARKLIEDAIAYALTLGLAPHPDYKKAARVLGGIDARECDTVFTFGKDGKPLYFQGPHDSPARVQQILLALRTRCGEGNYHFILGGPVSDAEVEGGEEEPKP